MHLAVIRPWSDGNKFPSFGDGSFLFFASLLRLPAPQHCVNQRRKYQTVLDWIYALDRKNCSLNHKMTRPSNKITASRNFMSLQWDRWEQTDWLGLHSPPPLNQRDRDRDTEVSGGRTVSASLPWPACCHYLCTHTHKQSWMKTTCVATPTHCRRQTHTNTLAHTKKTRSYIFITDLINTQRPRAVLGEYWLLSRNSRSGQLINDPAVSLGCRLKKKNRKERETPRLKVQTEQSSKTVNSAHSSLKLHSAKYFIMGGGEKKKKKYPVVDSLSSFDHKVELVFYLHLLRAQCVHHVDVVSSFILFFSQSNKDAILPSEASERSGNNQPPVLPPSLPFTYLRSHPQWVLGSCVIVASSQQDRRSPHTQKERQHTEVKLKLNESTQ